MLSRSPYSAFDVLASVQEALGQMYEGGKSRLGPPVEGQLINAAADIIILNIKELNEELKSRQAFGCGQWAGLICPSDTAPSQLCFKREKMDKLWQQEMLARVTQEVSERLRRGGLSLL